jgi:predicted  nucleic acid-binding Zn-ribbon protein
VLGGLFGGRRSRASVAAAARRAQTAQRRVDTARSKADDLTAQLADLEAEIAAEVAAIDQQWTATAAELQTLSVPVEKTDVSVVDLRLVWVPVAEG